ncbi:NAD(P)-binding domain-containing protein [soil metagenome]
MKVAVIGVGMMGGAMAVRLLSAGHAVRAFDVDPAALQRCSAAGATVAATPADAARDAQVVLLMVHDEHQIEQVLWGVDGVVAASASAATIWNASTVSREFAQALEQRLVSCGLTMVDGPVSGGVTAARDGQLTVIAGGTPQALAAAAPAMQACAATVHHVGRAGNGSVVKMINNLLAASQVALTAEALTLGRQAGVDLDQLIEVVNQSSGASRMFAKRAPRMSAGEHEPQVQVRTFLKDLDIALEAARRVSAATPIASAAREVYADAAAAGFALESDTHLMTYYAQVH